MKRKITAVLLIVLALVLEILPYGAVLNFADMDGSIRKTYSYFDLTPYGYANFGPLLTAVSTCVLLLLAVIALFKKGNGMRKAVCAVSGIAAVFSLMPLLYGVRNFSLVGAAISAVLAAVFVLSHSKKYK